MLFPYCRFTVTLASVVIGLCAPLAAHAQSADSLRARLVERGHRHNPELIAARSAVRAAEARTSAAGAREAPVLGFEVEEVPDGKLWDAGQVQLSLEQELFTGRRRGSAVSAAAVAVRRAQLVLLLRERSLEAQVDQYLAVWRGELAIDSRLALEEALLQQVEEGLTARLSAGEARYVDVLRLRSERLRVQTERAETMRRVQRARGRIAAMTSDSIDLRVALLPDEWSLPATPSIDSLLAELEAVGYFTLGDSLAAAEGRRDVAERAMRVTGGVGIQRFGEAGSFNVGPTLRASVSLPIAVGRSNRAVTYLVQAELARSGAAAAAERMRLRQHLREARDSYEAARDRAELFDAALLTGSRTEREAALDAYRSGDLSLLELLDFERALARAEVEQIRARMEARMAYATLLAPLAPLTMDGAHDD